MKSSRLAVIGACVAAAPWLGGAVARAEQRTGWFNAAVVRADGVAIPFQFFLSPEDGAMGSYIKSGSENQRIDARWSGGVLTIDFPQYDSRIVAGEAGGSNLAGMWERTGRGAQSAQMEFRASWIEGYDVFALFEETRNVTLRNAARAHGREKDLRWKMQFSESGPAGGVFRSIGAVSPTSPKSGYGAWVGTVETPTGDYRHLTGTEVWSAAAEGEEHGKRTLRMSVFDGAHAFLLVADIDDATGKITGDFWSGATWHEAFTAEPAPRDGDLGLPDPFSETTLKPGETKLRLAALDNPKYAGKAVIVQVFGTWCPNCHDEAPVLADLYKRHHAAGLEVLGLAYEHAAGDSADDERSRRQVARFKERYGAEWDIVIAGSSEKEKAAATLPALNAIKAFPTTIFINRDRTVRAIHTGFSGPATGEKFEKLKAEFERLVKETLASKP